MVSFGFISVWLSARHFDYRSFVPSALDQSAASFGVALEAEKVLCQAKASFSFAGKSTGTGYKASPPDFLHTHRGNRSSLALTIPIPAPS